MAESKAPGFDFQSHPSTSPFKVPPQTYLQNHPDAKFKYIATAALVFDNAESATPRVLLIQRSSQDSWPNCWEIPGGACDDEDESILHGVARELWEESGLVASYVGPSLGDGQQFFSSSGRCVGKFLFCVEALGGGNEKAPKVKLNPAEHQNFVWASEEEVKAKQKGDLKLTFTSLDSYNVIVEAFEQHRSGELRRL